MVIGIKTKILRSNQYLRVLVLVLLLIHVAISAWLVVNFSGEYTEGAPAPTKIDAIVVVDREETLIDVEMEQATSFLLYMIYRDYDESYGQNNSDNNSQITIKMTPRLAKRRIIQMIAIFWELLNQVYI